MPTDSELYTFNDFVSEEEVVSTNVISNCVEKNPVSKFKNHLEYTILVVNLIQIHMDGI